MATLTTTHQISPSSSFWIWKVGRYKHAARNVASNQPRGSQQRRCQTSRTLRQRRTRRHRPRSRHCRKRGLVPALLLHCGQYMSVTCPHLSIHLQKCPTSSTTVRKCPQRAATGHRSAHVIEYPVAGSLPPARHGVPSAERRCVLQIWIEKRILILPRVSRSSPIINWYVRSN